MSTAKFLEVRTLPVFHYSFIQGQSFGETLYTSIKSQPSRVDVTPCAPWIYPVREEPPSTRQDCGNSNIYNNVRRQMCYLLQACLKWN